MSNSVYFKPWVGKDYQSGGIFKKKILVVGEAHVCGGCESTEDCRKFRGECDMDTSKVVRNYLEQHSGDWSRTYRKFERSLVNRETTDEESSRIWNSLAFFEYLQVATPNSRSRIPASDTDYQEGGRAFFEVINELKPELIIVWGVTRMYEKMPEDNWRQGEDLSVDGFPIKNGWYKLEDGTEVRTIWTYHPSVGYDWSWWYKAISTQM